MKTPEIGVQQEQMIDISQTGGVIINIVWPEGYPPQIAATRFGENKAGQGPMIPPDILMMLARTIADAMGQQTAAMAQRMGQPQIELPNGPIPNLRG